MPQHAACGLFYFVNFFFLKDENDATHKPRKKMVILASGSAPLGLDKGGEHGVGIDITAVSLVDISISRVQRLQDGVHQV